MVLGSLMIQLSELGILKSPDAPFDGFSIRRLLEDLRGMKKLRYCEHVPQYYGRNACARAEDHFNTKLSELERQIAGIELKGKRTQ